MKIVTAVPVLLIFNNVAFLNLLLFVSLWFYTFVWTNLAMKGKKIRKEHAVACHLRA